MNPRLFEKLHQEAQAAASFADPAHDFGHVTRVVRSATTLARTEGAQVEVVRVAALLHELVNLPKSHPESSRSGELCAHAAARLLEREGAEAAFTAAVSECIRVHAFSAELSPTSLEAKILQDADRLDAIGAIGIARCFATCSSMGRPFYSEADPFCEHRPPDDKAWGLDHFYRKLLRIESSLHTATARTLAKTRVSFMNDFLNQLRSEIRVDL
jgi:uncharacterized protein